MHKNCTLTLYKTNRFYKISSMAQTKAKTPAKKAAAKKAPAKKAAAKKTTKSKGKK